MGLHLPSREAASEGTRPELPCPLPHGPLADRARGIRGARAGSEKPGGRAAWLECGIDLLEPGIGLQGEICRSPVANPPCTASKQHS